MCDGAQFNNLHMVMKYSVLFFFTFFKIPHLEKTNIYLENLKIFT